MKASYTILLVQENPEYAAALELKLREETTGMFQLKSVSTLAEAVDVLTVEKIDALLLELSLPDSRGLETFDKLQAAAPGVPIVILTGMDEEILALKAVQRGAQDYLLKIEAEGRILRRAIRHAIERHRLRNELISLSFVDDLTGLYNRRGFMVLSEHQSRVTLRSRKGFLLFLADFDNLKSINDIYGHLQGDVALVRAAEILRKTFRKSDILARLSGDEFAVLALETGLNHAEIISRRLETAFEEYNMAKPHPFRVSLSAGNAYFDPDHPVSLENLIATADSGLYAAKRGRISPKIPS